MQGYKVGGLAASSSGKKRKYHKRIIYNVTEGIASPETRRKYSYSFNSFVNHFEGLTEESLYEEDRRTIESMLVQWIHYLSTERKQKHGTIHHEVAAILHWCDWNDIVVNKRRIRSTIPEDEQIDQDRCYTTSEIEQILSECDERGRVIIFLMTSTGMRIGALSKLKFGDLTEVAWGVSKLYKIQVYARTRYQHYTFCTPECKNAIDQYRIFREVHGETIDNNSPLVRELFDTDAKYAAAQPKSMRTHGLESFMHRILLRTEVKSTDVMRCHGLRKFYISQCINAKVDYNTREYLVGHKHSRGLDVHYDRVEEDARLAEYSKAIGLLTISSEEKLKRELQESQQKLKVAADKEAEVAQKYKLIPKREWENMKDEIKAIKEKILPELYEATGKGIHLDHLNYSDNE